MSKRRTHSPEFKANAAMNAISGSNTLWEIATAQASSSSTGEAAEEAGH
jgi:transposase-like protein